MKNLTVAVSLLTRVPMPLGARRSEVAGSVPWWPVVGAAVGSVVGLVYLGLAAWVPRPAAAGVSLGAGLLLTGAFHEDGLADAADALGATSREEALRIMRDPHHGTYGVAALSLGLLVRAGAMSALAGWPAVGAIAAAHALSRGAAVGLVGALPPAAPEGLGASYAGTVGGFRVAAGCAASVVLGAIGLGAWVVPAAISAAAAAIAVGALARNRIGGITGDVLGAAQQVAETGVLLLAAGAARSTMGLPLW